jgi:kelch-like protein 10
VKDNVACRPTVLEVLTFFHDVQMMTGKDREILTPEFARSRIPPDILFCFGGNRDGNPTNCFEAYDVRADRWVKVSSTQI